MTGRPDGLAWAIARWAARLPRMVTFVASPSALAGMRLAQETLGAKIALWGHGGAYDPRGELALYERGRLFNRRPRARLGLPGALECLSRGTRLLATPAQVDGAANANLSIIGADWGRPKIAVGGTRGLPDATEIHFVIPVHSPRQLVPTVDFVSTAGSGRAVPPWLFTEFCALEWSPPDKGWRLRERQAGVPVADIQERSGFPIIVDGDVTEIPPPEAAVLHMLDRVDPRHVRELDFTASPPERLARLRALEAAEHEAIDPRR